MKSMSIMSINRILLLLVLLAPSNAVAAAITLNATGTTQNNSTATASPINNAGLTIAAGSARYLVCVMNSRDDALPGIAMTWNSVSMTLLNSQKQDVWDEYAYIFGLANPDTGNNTVSLSWTGGVSRRIVYRCVCLNNVASVSGTLTNGSATNANPTGNIATASGDATVSMLSNSGSVSAVSHTQLFADVVHGAAQYNISTGSSDAHTYTMTSSNWGLAGVRLLQTGGGGGTVRNLTMMGVGQ